jgi:tetratricopeptide (TPR) repeat protein
VDRIAPSSREEDWRTYRYLVLVASGNLAGLADLLESNPGEDWYDSGDFGLAITHFALGDAARALPHLEIVAARATTDPADPGLLSQAGIALELLGRHEEAERAADRAVELLPENRDALNGAETAMRRAWVLIHGGSRREEGYRELERLLGHIDLQPRWVAATPLWQILRDDARAQEILQRAMPKT